jgi:uncharacterized tellurite resistance protein B-like protein
MALVGEERVVYLASLVSVARIDGSVSPKESDAIERIQKRMGAKKTELNKAMKLAERDDYKIQPIGHFADKVQNLEDLFYVSAVDGEIHAQEKTIIVNFATDIGVTKDQLNLIMGDIKRLITSGTARSSCPACGAEVPVNARFCATCGAAVSVADSEKAVSVSYEIPSSGVTIEFAESTAAGFADAVKIAGSASSNATCVKGKKTWYLASWPIEDIEEAIKLTECLKGMRNRKVYVDGTESRWDEVFGFVWCAQARNTAYRPIEYCCGLDEKRLNIWGCRQAHMDWTDWADWFSYGSYKKGGLLKNQPIFVFDKNRIRHEIETNLFRCRYCPYLNFDLIQAAVDAFPDEVTPSEKGPWLYRRDYEETPGSLKVKTKISEGGYTYTDEFFSNGVAPKNPYLGLEILKKAIDAMDMQRSSFKGVLEYKDSWTPFLLA